MIKWHCEASNIIVCVGTHTCWTRTFRRKSLSSTPLFRLKRSIAPLGEVVASGMIAKAFTRACSASFTGSRVSSRRPWSETQQWTSSNARARSIPASCGASWSVCPVFTSASAQCALSSILLWLSQSRHDIACWCRSMHAGENNVNSDANMQILC